MRHLPHIALCLLPHAAFAQAAAADLPETLAKHILELKAEMIRSISTHKTCVPEARMLTKDSYIPFGFSGPKNLPPGGLPEATKSFVLAGTLLAKNNILSGSVFVLCRESHKVGEETLSPVFTIAAEHPNGYAAVHHFEYRIAQAEVTITREAIQQAVPLFFKQGGK